MREGLRPSLELLSFLAQTVALGRQCHQFCCWILISSSWVPPESDCCSGSPSPRSGRRGWRKTASLVCLGASLECLLQWVTEPTPKGHKKSNCMDQRRWRCGADRRLGGSESARTEHPNREVVSSRPCVRARSVIHVESGMKWGVCPLPFSLLAVRVLAFPFSLQDL